MSDEKKPRWSGAQLFSRRSLPRNVRSAHPMRLTNKETRTGIRRQATIERRAAKLVSVLNIRHDSGRKPMPDPTSLLEIGARLAVTPKALGLTQAEMDRRMGSALSNGQTFNFYETGRQRIPTHHALALCRTCNITLDWIYRGQMHSLQPDACAKIENELDRQP